MKFLLLNRGLRALVDDQDWNAVRHHLWTAKRERNSIYATATINGVQTRLHVLLMGKAPKGFVIDHINRNGLDNRRSNLRIATYSENGKNTHIHQRVIEQNNLNKTPMGVSV